MASDEEEDYFVPLVDQRVFGAGIKRKRVAFVPASLESTGHPPGSDVGKRLSNKYLSLVLKEGADSRTPSTTKSDVDTLPSICSVCDESLSLNVDEQKSHESSIAHQVRLAHSHPPSHLDRSRTGLRYLQNYGWDPDARRGLGAQQRGILAPVKAKQKSDTAGIGTESRDDDRDIDLKPKRKLKQTRQEVVKLNAKAVKEIEIEKGKRAERLRQSFYCEDLSPYLGPNG